MTENMVLYRGAELDRRSEAERVKNPLSTREKLARAHRRRGPARPCTSVVVIREETGRGGDGGFDILFYGLDVSDLCVIPNDYVAAAMERRKLYPGYTPILWSVEELT